MYISDQQVANIQDGLEMVTVMMLQTMNGVTLMAVIVADPTLIHITAQFVYA